MAKAYNPFNDTFFVVAHNTKNQEYLKINVSPIDEYKEKFIAYLEDFNKTYELPKYKNDLEYSPTTSKTIESFIKIIKDDKSIKKSCNDKSDNTKEYFTNAPDIV